ncbi:MAG: type II secretion system protein J [Gemmatimonadaceae bacterium]
MLRLTSRRGFTLAEMVLAFLLFSLVGGTILTLVMRQQRFYRGAADVIRVHAQLRQGASVLPLDLRSVSTSDTLVNTSAGTKYNADIYAKADWMVEFRRTFGTSVLCRIRAAARDTIFLVPKTLVSEAAITTWGADPAVGDSLLILDEGKLLGAGDDRWRAYKVKAITTVTGTSGCPFNADSTTRHLLTVADTSRPSYKITLDRALETTFAAPTPVRVFRRVRYEVYEAGDRQWYLGYSDCLDTYTTASKCSVITPVSGPYLPYTGVAKENGLTFAYYDSLGNLLATTAESRRVARIGVVMRTETEHAVSRTGADMGEKYRDTVVLTIGIRNRR